MALTLREVCLLEFGPTLSIVLEPGRSLVVVGPAGAGKSRLLRVIAGREEPDRGQIGRPATIAFPKTVDRALRPQEIGRRRGDGLAAPATEVLSGLRLWEARQTPVSELPAAQAAACELIEPLLEGSELFVLDGLLDRLDPWTQVGALNLLTQRMSAESTPRASVVVATNRLELAAWFDFVVVLDGHGLVVAGAVEDLAAEQGQRSLTVETTHHRGARALVGPLEIGVERVDGGYRFGPNPHQDLTAKLLRESYGDVRYLVTEPRSLPEILLDLIRP